MPKSSLVFFMILQIACLWYIQIYGYNDTITIQKKSHQATLAVAPRLYNTQAFPPLARNSPRPPRTSLGTRSNQGPTESQRQTRPLTLFSSLCGHAIHRFTDQPSSSAADTNSKYSTLP